MRFALAAAVISGLIASVVSAHMLESPLSHFPPCAADCISGASLSGCTATDFACLCKNKAFVSSVTLCICSSCKGSELIDAKTAAQGMCGAVGVTLTGSCPS